MLGSYYRDEAKEAEKAVAVWMTALRQNPRLVDLREMCCDLLCLLGRKTEAEHVARRLPADSPRRRAIQLAQKPIEKKSPVREPTPEAWAAARPVAVEISRRLEAGRTPAAISLFQEIERRKLLLDPAFAFAIMDMAAAGYCPNLFLDQIHRI